MTKPRISLHIANRLLNTPLAVKADYLLTMIGALQHKGLPILELNNGDDSLSSGDLSAMASSYQANHAEATQRRPYHVNGGIAYISVTGSLVHKYGHLEPYSGMTGYDGIRACIDIALADDEVTALAVDMDSPGGEVAGCFALGDYIFNHVRGQKPIWALVNELSCSASYAVAAACDQIVLTETAIAGSIGVICGHSDMTKAYENAGFKVTLFYSGSHKADMHPLKPMDSELSAELQATMSELHTLFASKVALWRGLDVEAVKATESRIYRGQAAVDVGLADAVMSVDEFHSNLLNHTAAKGGATLGVEPMSKTTVATSVAATLGADAATITEPGAAPQADAGTIGVDAATAERERVFAIIGCDAATNRQPLAKQLAATPGMTLAQAEALLNTSPEEVAATASGTQLAEALGEHAAATVSEEDSEDDVTDELADSNSLMNSAFGAVK